MPRETVVWVVAKTLGKALDSARSNPQYADMTVVRGKLDKKNTPVKRMRVLGYKKYKIYLKKRKLGPKRLKEDIEWVIKSGLKTRISMAGYFNRRGYDRATTQRAVEAVESQRWIRKLTR